jgi:hypothetical protein
VAFPIRLAAAEDGDYTPLEVRKEDKIHLKNGAVIVGRVLDDLPDKGVVLRLPDRSETRFPGDQIQYIEDRQTAQIAVRARGHEDIQNRDWTDLQKTLTWGLKNDAKDTVLKVAADAIAIGSNIELAERIVPLLTDAGEADAARALLEPLLAANKQWSKGYELEANVLQTLGLHDELTKLVSAWLAVEPTAQTPLRFSAAAAELAGDLRTAHESYRKLADYHHDDPSAVGQARTALRLGHAAEALQVTSALIEKNSCVDEARAIAGAALLTQGDEAKAGEYLAQALAGKLSKDTSDFVRYDLGLIAYRAGKSDEARAQWADLKSPLAQLGMSILDGKQVDPAAMPPELKAVALEYDACQLLERKSFERAAALLADDTLPRRDFLAQVAGLRVATPEAVRALEQTPGVDSLRWQAFGYITIRHWAEAEAALAQLQENDGYAAVCRVFIAAARHDNAAAKALVEKARAAADPPREYLAALVRYYEGQPRAWSETFEGTLNDLHTRDWQERLSGTGIDVSVLNQRLVFDGTQQSSDNNITSLERSVASGFSYAMATFDCSALNGATCGIMVQDANRERGVAFAVMGDGKLGWRQESGGTWGSWNELNATAHTTQNLRIDVTSGVAQVVSSDPELRADVAHGVFKSGEAVIVGLFGAADPGVKWHAEVHDYFQQWLTGDEGAHR